MKKRSTSKNDQSIPELKRDQLGVGVRGKYHKQFTQAGQMPGNAATESTHDYRFDRDAAIERK